MASKLQLLSSDMRKREEMKCDLLAKACCMHSQSLIFKGKIKSGHMDNVSKSHTIKVWLVAIKKDNYSDCVFSLQCSS